MQHGLIIELDISLIIDVIGELTSNQYNKKSIYRKEDLSFNNSIEFKNIYFKYDSSKYFE